MNRKLVCSLISLLYLLSFNTISQLHAQPMRKQGKNPFQQMDIDNDGKLSTTEFKGSNKAFSRIDQNKDGYLSRKEMADFHQNRSGGSPKAEKNEKEGRYPALVVKAYDKEKTWNGNVVFVDKHWNRIVECDLNGKVVWECEAPTTQTCGLDGSPCGGSLTDVEILPNANLLVLIGGDGVYELTKDGAVTWSYHNSTVSHDADRLKNGNTLMACVGAELNAEFPYQDPQAIEVNKDGEIVWAWYAKNEYANSKYKDIRSKDANDWTHMNSVQRLADGTTLLSVRNWNLLVFVDKGGKTVWTTGTESIPTGPWGKDSPHCPHTPVMLDNGNIIISEPINGRVVEWSPKEKRVVWSYPATTWRKGGPYYFVRAAHRLPNGNTFIIDSIGQFLEVTFDGELVWHAQLADYIQHDKPLSKGEISQAPCFNADRRGMPYYGGR